MADIHCDATNGSDITPGDGSVANPYGTVQKCIDEWTSGDVIRIGDTSAQVLTAALSWASFAGTSSTSWLTIRGWDYSGGAGANGIGEIDGNGAVSTLFSTTSRPNYVCLEGLKLHNVIGGYVLDAGTYWHLVNCEISNGDAAQLVRMLSSGLALNCYFHTPGNTTTGGLYLDDFGAAVACHFDAMDGEAIEIASGKDGVSVVGCLLSDCGDDGILVAGKNPVIWGNTIQGDGTAGKMGIDASSAACWGLLAANNIITDFSGAGGYGIYIDNTRGPITGSNQFDNNATNMNQTPEVDLGGDISADPAFANEASDDYTPGTFQAGYPATLGGGNMELAIGAIQRAAASGGGLLIHPGMNGGANG